MNLFRKIFIIILAIMLFLLFITGCGDKSEPETKPVVNGIGVGIDSDTSEKIIESGDYAEPENPAAENGGVSGKCEDGFVFIYNGAIVYMGDYIGEVLDEIGAHSDYYESESCTSDGMMQTYCYSGFEIYTYARTDAEEYRVFSVAFIDDGVSTAEGLYIGQTIGDMIDIYGNDYESLPGFYKYKKNGTGLSFDVDGNIITAITYTLLNI
ncbi:MAG: hypothetical protein FWF92_02935 [Oscillospiraceae bacterium]|nr:hypothetical protein [Oscillospiraceae bacterium]